MRIDTTTARGGMSRDPADYQFPTGMYLCRLVNVEDIGPRPDDGPEGTPRLVFEFMVIEGPYTGKKAATFVFKKLTPPGPKSKGSKLFEVARMLGVVDPMQGFDTSEFVGRYFQVMCQENNDRTWPQTFVPAQPPPASQSSPPPSAPAAAVPTAPAPTSAPPPRRRPAMAAPPPDRKFWCEFNPDGDPELRTVAELIEWVRLGNAPDMLSVCQDGTTDWVFLSQAVPETVAIRAKSIPF